MPSLARRNRAKIIAAKAASAAGAPPAGVAAAMPETGEGAHEYRSLLAALHNDLRNLSDTQSIEARNPLKRDMAATYQPWVIGALLAGKDGQAAQDEIVVTMMIWAIDYRDIDWALEIAEHVIGFGLALPDRYNRTAPCLIAEEIATAALDNAAAVTHAQLVKTVELTEASDMPDQARAKLMKALGRSFATAAAEFEPEADNAVAGGQAHLLTAAVESFTRALGLNRNIGVKKDLEAAQRHLAKISATADQSGDGQDGQSA